MQRYPSAGSGAGAGSNAVGGTARENARGDSAFAASNFGLNQRRLIPPPAYRIKCDKDPLSSRLGPPDFYPQSPNCAEETLTREYIQSGYKETVDGIEEAREIVLTQTTHFSKPDSVIKCKEGIRKRLRAINESRTQKRKAGQVYGVPLSGSLVTRPGVFPEQKPCGEDFRRKWIEALSHHQKRLRSLSEQVPHGYRKKSLFEVLIRHNVPLLRATWFIKVTYLNQIRPASTSISSGTLDKPQNIRTDLWTKDVIEYLQQLLEEFFSKDSTFASTPSRDQSRSHSASLPPHRVESVSSIDVEEPSLQSKWWYMVHLLQWHYAEGLLLPSSIIEWAFNQLQEKASAEALELLLPIVTEVIENIALSQNYVRMFVEIAVRSINDLTSGDSPSIDDSKRSQLSSALAEMLRYLILAAPDSFVALDCFPLPVCVVPDVKSLNVTQNMPRTVHGISFDTCDAYSRYSSFGYAISSLQKRASDLAKIVNPGIQGHGAATVVQALDKALIMGDVRLAYRSLFEELSDPVIEERWISDVSPCLRVSLKWMGNVSSSLVCSVFFLCEWATCDYRDCRATQNSKFTGGRDFSPVYIAVQILKLSMEDVLCSKQSNNVSPIIRNTGEAGSVHDNSIGGTAVENISSHRNILKDFNRKKRKIDLSQSPGPLHDIIVCWLDQHEIGKDGGFKCLQVLIAELIRGGIFYPQAYVRQLIVSGIMDRNATSMDLERQKRHHRVLKQLPGSCLFDVLEEARIAEVPLLHESVSIYSSERRLVLDGFLSGHSNHIITKADSYMSSMSQKQTEHPSAARDCKTPSLLEHRRNTHAASSSLSYKHDKRKAQVVKLKVMISSMLDFPPTSTSPTETQTHENHRSLKRPLGSVGINADSTNGMSGCDDCRRAKRHKLSDERNSYQMLSSSHSDDENTWWMKKGPQAQELNKVDQLLKSSKHASRGRQKNVRKTQSLAHLAASRIESSQEASTSHICDDKACCSHHKSVIDGEIPKDIDRIKIAHLSDIGKSLRQLRLLEKRSISIWLLASVKQFVEGNEKAASNASNSSGTFSLQGDDKSANRWSFGEDELSSILYILDITSDLISTVRLLLWLLPKISGGPSATLHAGRNLVMPPRNRENQVSQVREAFLFSSLRRYENVLLAADLLPEALTAAMHRTLSLTSSSGRSLASMAFAYARNLLKKYRDVTSVEKWETNFRASCDQRILAELDSGRSLDGDFGYFHGVSTGLEDYDEYIRQKMNGRMSRAGSTMNNIVQRQVEEAVTYFYERERKIFAATTVKHPIDQRNDAYRIAQEIVLGLVDYIRQNGGATQEADPSVVAAAVSAIICNVGPTVAKLPDFAAGSSSLNFSSTSSLNCVRHILNIHITSLCLLKEALGERVSSTFEFALAAEASSAISVAFTPPKSHRNQFQQSPEMYDINQTHLSEPSSNSGKMFVGRAAKGAAAVSALVIGAIVHGVSSLERMVSLFKLKEGLDVMHFIRNTRSSSNGVSRSFGTPKLSHCVEVFVHLFRLLIGNCRTVFDGLVAEILGEPYILALSRMQRLLPLNLVLPPAYAIFAIVIWRQYIVNSNIATREEILLYQYLSLAIGDAIRHRPFRDSCLRNTSVFYDLLATDTGDSEFAAMLEVHSSDKHLKTMAFVPLRARLFLNAIIDCKLPPSAMIQEDGSWITRPHESRAYVENEAKPPEQLVHVLDTLQPAKFHWQWVELRLLLHEQALIEKVETQNMSFVDAIRSLTPNAENYSLSESEKNLTEILLTRILVRPDAARLYSAVVHLLGRSLEESLIMNVKWILAGNDVLLGRKSIRQQLVYVAQRKKLSTRSQFWKPWGWSCPVADVVPHRLDSKKPEAMSIEEGEVVDDCIDVKIPSKSRHHHLLDVEGVISSQQYLTEKALAELLFPCIDRSSSDLRSVFATELIKQMSAIDQQINTFTRGGNKQNGVPTGVEGSSNKGSSRKGIRGGSPGLGRRPAGVTDTVPPSAAAIKTSIWLRLQFVLRLLPVIYADREPSSRNMRYMLASIILRLLGARIVHEDADMAIFTTQATLSKKEMDPLAEAPVSLMDNSGESLFDTFLCVLHGLLGNCKPSWMKSSASKSTVKSPRDFSVFDREAAENLQGELDRMELPAAIRRRIQAAMPALPPFLHSPIPCHPPTLSPASITSLQPSASSQGPRPRLLPCSRTSANTSRTKSLPSQDLDMEIDPWMLLEDGTGSTSASSGSNAGGASGDQSNLKACSWLKGAVRVRRTDLTYTGALDDDS